MEWIRKHLDLSASRRALGDKKAAAGN